MKTLKELVNNIDEAYTMPMHDAKELGKQFERTVDRYEQNELDRFINDFMNYVTMQGKNTSVTSSFKKYVNDNL